MQNLQHFKIPSMNKRMMMTQSIPIKKRINVIPIGLVFPMISSITVRAQRHTMQNSKRILEMCMRQESKALITIASRNERRMKKLKIPARTAPFAFPAKQTRIAQMILKAKNWKKK